MRWLKDSNDDIYDPEYTDMLRVAFTSEFGRGKLQDLVALLSGRNFETKQFEDVVAEESFAKLKTGVLAFMNQTHFERLTMILRSAGYVTAELIGGRNAVNFAYVLYLRGRTERVPAAQLESLIRRWYVMSALRARYSGSPESQFDFDIRQVNERGLLVYVESVIVSELPDSYWTGMLPQMLTTSSRRSPFFLAYQAAQVKLGDFGFLSKDIAVRDMVLNRGDVHHIYPKGYLKKLGLTPSSYNQIANFAMAQTEINITVGDRSPETYFAELAKQADGGPMRYGGIVDLEMLRANLRQSCLPESLLDGDIPSYEDFLDTRRLLMAAKLQTWFASL